MPDWGIIGILWHSLFKKHYGYKNGATITDGISFWHQQKGTSKHIAQEELGGVEKQRLFKHTDKCSGDCRALDKNSEMVPSRKLLICKQRDCKGVLNSSGNW